MVGALLNPEHVLKLGDYILLSTEQLYVLATLALSFTVGFVVHIVGMALATARTHEHELEPEVPPTPARMPSPSPVPAESIFTHT